MVILMKNKKSNLILYFLIAVIVVVGILLVYKLAFKTEENSNLTSITATELENKINNKDTFILVISQTGCSHCEQYLPELNRTLKEVNLNAFEINLTNLNSEETSILNKYVNVSGTPTTIFYHDGEEATTLNRISGYTPKTKIKERLKSLGYID